MGAAILDNHFFKVELQWKDFSLSICFLNSISFNFACLQKRFQWDSSKYISHINAVKHMQGNPNAVKQQAD